MTTMPVDKSFFVTSVFGARDGGTHWGTDFGKEGGSGGQPVYAARRGTVVYAGPAGGFGGPDPAGWVVVDSPDGGTQVYGHVIREVTVGDYVSEGQRIARINPDIRTNGGTPDKPIAPHLHFEWHRYVWVNPGPDRLDPMVQLAGAGWPGEAPPTPQGLDTATLSEVMGSAVPQSRYAELLPGFVDAMRAAKITTVPRAAMWCAQLGHESVGLRHMREIASGSAYEGRADLGNTQPGDGVRFAGRGPIQITGRSNYARLSQWAHGEGLVPSPTFFVDNPAALESPQYGFLGAVWYWTVARNINVLADLRDLEGATRAINGGLNGLDDRRARYNRAAQFGERLLPGEELNMDELKKYLTDFIKGYVGPIGQDVKDIREQLCGKGSRDSGQYKGWAQLGTNEKGQPLTVVDAIAALRADVDALKEGK